MSPKITIAIPVYNRQDLISRAIESVLSQSGDDVELVIVDNNSTDNTYEVAKKFSKENVKVYKNERNLGFTKNCIKCIEYANGEWFRFLMSDDIFLPGAIGLMKDVIASNANVDLLFSNGITGNKVNVEHECDDVEIISAEEYNSRQRHWKYYRFPAMPNAYSIRTSCMKKMIADNDFLRICKELEFPGHCVDYLMLTYNAAKSKKIAIINKATYKINIHDQEESFFYRNDILLHLSGDYYAVSQVYKPSFIEKFYFYIHAFKTYYSTARRSFRQGLSTVLCVSRDFIKVLCLIALSHIGVVSEKVYKL